MTSRLVWPFCWMLLPVIVAAAFYSPSRAEALAVVQGEGVSPVQAEASKSKVLLLYGGRELTREAVMQKYRMLRTSHSEVGLQRSEDVDKTELLHTGTVVAAGSDAVALVNSMKGQLAAAGVRVITPAEGSNSNAVGVESDSAAESRAAITYVMLRDANPLLDFSSLEQKAEWLHEREIPFFLELRPVFVNTEMTRMKSFFKEVRHLEELGAIPLLAPLKGWTPSDEWQTYVEGNMTTGVIDSQEPEQLMQQAWDAYANEGIYAAGLSGPLDLLLDPSWSAVMTHSSLFIEDGGWRGYSRDIALSSTWKGTFLPEWNAAAVSGWELPAHSPRVIGIDADASLSELEAAAQSSSTKWGDASMVNGRSQWQGKAVERQAGQLLLSGELTYTPALEEQPQPTPVPILPTDQNSSLTLVNRRIKTTMLLLLMGSILVAAAFTAFFVIGRQINRRKHLR